MNNKSIINMMTFHAKRLFLLFVLGITFAVNSFAAVEYIDSNNNLKYLIDKTNNTATLAANNYSGNINIPERVTFDGTPYSVKALADECFKGCKELGTVTIPSSVIKLGKFCFASSTLSAITIPNSVTELGAYCFNACSYLTSITIPNSIKELPTHCFYNANLSEGISLPNTINKIGNSCFYNCYFTNIELPSSVTEIGDSTFMNCSELTSIKFPENLKKISYYCLHQCKKITEVELPKTLEIIEDGSFFYCSSLEQISIPSTVKEMNCFRKISAGTTTSIGIFSYCSKLKQITIPASVTTIGYRMFGNCSSLESITIGSSVKSIDGSAFEGCSGIKEINCYAVEPPKTSVDPFGNIENLNTCILNVPKGSETKYKNTNYWTRFKNISTLNSPEAGIDALTANFTDEGPNIPEGTYYAGNLTYTRTGEYVKAGKYVAQCLPFDINLAETKCFTDVFIPMDIALYNTNPNSQLLTLMLDKVDMTSVIKAGQPFIAKLAEDKVEVKNYNPTYISSNYAEQEIETDFKVYDTTGQSGVLLRNYNLKVRFGGTYQYKSGLDEDVYRTFMSTGQFGKSDHVLPYRAYVYKANAAAQAAVQSITWGVGDETTGIKYIVTPEISKKDNKVFTLDGKLVNQTGDTKSLKKGIYIINGRKIIIK